MASESVAHRPSISVAVATYQRAGVLPRLLNALSVQTDPPDEVIIVDDGSTDGTADVARAYQHRGWEVISQPNQGLSVARNRGAASAESEWLVFVDDDDLPTNEWIAQMRPMLEADVGFVSWAASFVTPDGQEGGSIAPADLGPAFDGETALLLAGCFAVRRDLFLDAGGYAVGLRCSHQTELGLRVLGRCTSAGLRVVASESRLISIERRPPSERPMSSPAALLSGAEMVMDRHGDRLRRDVFMLRGFHAVAGVSAARLGRFPDARRHLWHAARLQPTDFRGWMRLAVALAPIAARRVWRSRNFVEDAHE